MARFTYFRSWAAIDLTGLGEYLELGARVG